MASQVASAHDLAGGCPVSGAANAPWRFEKLHAIAEFPIELLDSIRRLIHKHDRPAMLCEPFGRSFLIVPRKAVFRVMRELDIVGWIGVNEIVAVERNDFNIGAGERSIREHVSVRCEVARVADPGLTAKGHVEAALRVEST